MTKELTNTNFFQIFDQIAAPWVFFNSELIVFHANASFQQNTEGLNFKSDQRTITSIFDFSMPDEVLKELLMQNCGDLQHGLELGFSSPQPALTGGRLVISKLTDGNECVFAGMVVQKLKQKNKTRPDVSDHHLFRMLLNELPDAIYFKDRNGKFFLTNRLHTKKLGFKDVNDFIGKTDFDLFSEEHARQAYDDEQEVIRTGISMSKEEKETRLDGSVTWASTSKMPLRDEQGRIVGTFGISKDITKIKEVEQELRNARKQLEEANASKDMFFSIIAHDLKNAFNTLIGLSEIVREDYDQLNDSEKKNMIGNINSVSESTYNLLENLLDWSRMQSGSIPYNPENICLNELFEDLIVLMQGQAEAKNIRLANKISSRVKAYADPNMVRTILRNLVSNAIKFTKSGGEIIIEAKTEGENCFFRVKDNGVGIEKKNLEKLFSISEIVKTSGTANESGTGLGLMLCRDFAERNGGQITVESTPGDGSCFIVDLPAGK